jgi:hypothetical protein
VWSPQAEAARSLSGRGSARALPPATLQFTMAKLRLGGKGDRAVLKVDKGACGPLSPLAPRLSPFASRLSPPLG